MSDKPKPLTKAEWGAIKPLVAASFHSDDADRIIATLDALFEYRYQTTGIVDGFRHGFRTDETAADLGLD